MLEKDEVVVAGAAKLTRSGVVGRRNEVVEKRRREEERREVHWRSGDCI